MIDYKYPLVLEIQEVYREARDAENTIHTEKENSGTMFADPESGKKALDSLKTAPTRLSELRESLTKAEDLSEEDKNYYLGWMANHQSNVDGWLARWQDTQF